MSEVSNADEAVLRGLLPEVLFLPDLAPALGVGTTSAARRLIVDGGCPHCYVGRRLAVRRTALLEWIEERERVAVPPVPAAAPWAVALLARKRSPQRRKGGGR